MKTIESVAIWSNGETKEASILNAYAINVCLGSSATFYYQLMSQDENGYSGLEVAKGNLTMSGDEYAQWEADTFAWDWIAGKLNLTITGDYVSPTPPVIEPEVIAPEVTAEEEVETTEG